MLGSQRPEVRPWELSLMTGTSMGARCDPCLSGVRGGGGGGGTWSQRRHWGRHPGVGSSESSPCWRGLDPTPSRQAELCCCDNGPTKAARGAVRAGPSPGVQADGTAMLDTGSRSPSASWLPEPPAGVPLALPRHQPEQVPQGCCSSAETTRSGERERQGPCTCRLSVSSAVGWG